METEKNTGMWNLFRIEKTGIKTPLGSYHDNYGCDAMGCDMHDWMIDSGHYDGYNPEIYEWEGDTESVAIMGSEDLPDFAFYWVPVGEEVECVLWLLGEPIPGHAKITGEEGAVTEFIPTFERETYSESIEANESDLEPCEEANHGYYIDLYDGMNPDADDASDAREELPDDSPPAIVGDYDFVADDLAYDTARERN